MKHNPRRILGHLKRLMREGDEMLHDQPLDEVAHAKWCDRTEKYMTILASAIERLELNIENENK